MMRRKMCVGASNAPPSSGGRNADFGKSGPWQRSVWHESLREGAASDMHKSTLQLLYGDARPHSVVCDAIDLTNRQHQNPAKPNR
jgi:hypothetical protein